MSRTLQELVDAYVEENNLRFEGDPGVESLNKFFVALDNNYKPSGFRYGSPLEQFFADNSGACEAVLEWVGKQRIKHWQENLENEVAPEEDEESGLVVITFPDEASVINASERISYTELDRLDCTLEVEADDLTPELRAEFRELGGKFSEEE